MHPPIASPLLQLVGEPRLMLTEALDVCAAPVVARRLGTSERLVRGWRTGDSVPNLDHLVRAPRAFTGRIVLLLGDRLRADSLTRADPREALNQCAMALGALLVRLNKKPLDEMAPEEAEEIRERAALIEEQAAVIRRAAAQQARTVEPKEGGR